MAVAQLHPLPTLKFKLNMHGYFVGTKASCIFANDSSFRDVAQPGSALRSGRRGRRFKSCHPDFFRLSKLLGGLFFVHSGLKSRLKVGATLSSVPF